MVVLAANLDAEYEWANPDRSLPPKERRFLLERTRPWRSILRLHPAWRDAAVWDRERGAVLSASQVVGAKPLSARLASYPPRWGKEEEGETSLRSSALIAWGVTDSMARLANEQGWRWEAPPVSVVRDVNDKRTSHRWEQELGLALPYSRIVSSLRVLETAVLTCPHDWVLKHPMGVSGRERVVGKAGALPEPLRSWAEPLFAQGWELLFEPWVTHKRDFSLHFDITREGVVQRVGATQLATDQSGSFRGNRVSPGWEPPEGSWEAAEAVVEKVAARGYWGPVGVDALAGRLGGREVVRPVVEINARLSFGRLALAMLHGVPPSWSLLWWHPPVRWLAEHAERMASLPPLSPTHAQPGLYRLPEAADPKGASQTVALVAESSTALQQWERKLNMGVA